MTGTEELSDATDQIKPLAEVRSLPVGWIMTRIGKIVTDMRNGISGRQNKDGVGLPVSRIETISRGTIDMSHVGFLDNVSLEQQEKYRLRRGDILFSNINSDFHLGQTALFDSQGTFLLHGMNLLLLRAIQHVVIPRYLHYFSAYLRFSGYFISIAQHAVNQSSINQAKLKNVAIPLAPSPNIAASWRPSRPTSAGWMRRSRP